MRVTHSLLTEQLIGSVNRDSAASDLRIVITRSDVARYAHIFFCAQPRPHTESDISVHQRMTKVTAMEIAIKSPGLKIKRSALRFHGAEYRADARVSPVYHGRK